MPHSTEKYHNYMFVFRPTGFVCACWGGATLLYFHILQTVFEMYQLPKKGMIRDHLFRDHGLAKPQRWCVDWLEGIRVPRAVENSVESSASYWRDSLSFLSIPVAGCHLFAPQADWVMLLRIEVGKTSTGIAKFADGRSIAGAVPICFQ